MPKYVRAKKYLRFIVPTLIVLGAVLVPKAGHHAKAVLGAAIHNGSASSLRVSPSNQQMYTNVTADNLQSANSPVSSTAETKLSPQQAYPNYCSPTETPYIDGCIAH